MKATHRLSAQAVARAQATTRTLMLHDGHGLYLRVTPAGTKSWIYRFMRQGQRHDLGLGNYPLFSLSDARQRAIEKRRLLADGIDPRKRDTVQTFAQVAEQCVDALEPGLRNRRSAEAWRQSLRDYVLPLIGDIPVQEIDTPDVLRVVKSLWTDRNEMGSRLRSRIERVLDYAASAGYREAGQFNPALWRGHLEHLLARPSKVKRGVEHLAAMSYQQIPEFMAKVVEQQRVDAYALRFLILCASRTNEVIGARWDEINGRAWTVPAERMKGGREHRVPLSDAAMAVIATMRELRVNDFVFPGQKGPLGKGALHILMKQKLRRDETVHGLRSSFAQWAAEQTTFPYEVREQALAHTVGNVTERSYQRSDLFSRRAELMQQWAMFCQGT
jgi:integrase